MSEAKNITNSKGYKWFLCQVDIGEDRRIKSYTTYKTKKSKKGTEIKVIEQIEIIDKKVNNRIKTVVSNYTFNI